MVSNEHQPAETPANPGTQSVSPALRKRLQQCYEHGTKLFSQETYDFDYSHSLLLECVTGDPGNATYVDAFLQNLQRKYKNNKRGALLAFGGKGPFKKALAKKAWAEVLKLGPDVLKNNPWDVSTLRGMARGCAEFSFTDAELRYLKNALVPNPKDPEVNKHCAQSLARIGQFDQAIICWQRVDEARRGDDEAQKMISELQIAKTMGRGGLGGNEARRNAAKAAQAAAEAPTAVENAPPDSPRREIRRTQRQELEQDIVHRPADLDAYFELAELHIREQRLGEAAHVLAKAQAVSGNSLKVQERLEDVEILRKKEQLQVAERRAESEATDAARQLAEQLREDLHRIELEVFDRRSQRYPEDLELKFQLGLRLKRMGKFREATEPFQLAMALPERRSYAALEVGECLQRLKKYDRALEYYQAAAEERSEDRIEVRKLALYRLGLLAEGLKNDTVAEHGWEQLVALDPRYKDAASRLDKLRAIRHKQA
jgi:tetratricopeptide (TPR) repeat protein